jgi:hypothetical protein
MKKYPRTHHIEGSRLQPGDEDTSQVPFSSLLGHHLVVEEKLDGANAGLSFGPDGRLLLQSRGHYLTGGAREKHFDLFKQWAHTHAAPLRERLSHRYLLYGEWLYAKHTIFYDALPSHFLEFDILDLETGAFLSTPARHALLDGTPVRSVPVLRTGTCRALDELTALVGPSLYKTPRWRQHLDASAASRNLDIDRVRRETDPTDLMEGLYIKVESAGAVLARYKWVRATFLTQVIDSGSHWLSRPIIPNVVAP